MIYVPRRRRIYRGNVPSDGVLLDTRGEWELFQRPPRCAEFQRLKLISKLPRVGVANVHLAYHVAHRRLTRCTDARALARQSPELFLWVVQTAQHYFDGRAAVG